MTIVQKPMWAQRKYTSYEDKKRILIEKGFPPAEAIRMASQLPQVYG